MGVSGYNRPALTSKERSGRPYPSSGHWRRASSKERIAPWKVGCVSRMDWPLATAELIQYHRVLFPVPE